MKKLLLISMLIGAMPLSMQAQDDDLYFVAKKKKASKVEQVKEYAPVVAPQPKAKSSYEVIDGDTTKLDVIDFAEVKGVYPSDTLETEDYALTKKMMRFDDYDVSSNAAFWAGYNAGRTQWMWHSPWYYSRYGWYEPWYNSYWYNYYSPWYYSWYDPWYYGWYDPYWSSWGWPYYGYYGWNNPWYYGYYGHYGYYYPYYGGGGGGHHLTYRGTGNAGTRDLHDGSSRRSAYRNTVANNSQRMGSLRDRATSMGGSNVYRSGNTQRSGSGNFSGRRGGSSTVYSSGGSGSSSSNRSYSNSSSGSSRSSSSGSFSSGSRSGSFGSSSGSSHSGGFSSGGGSSRSTSSGGHGGGGRR